MTSDYSIANAMHTFPNYPELGKRHQGKVRDSYSKDGKRLIITTDRVSAFDRVMEQPIPHKGQVLTQIANYWFEATRHITKNHLINNPDPQVILVEECTPFSIEFIIRGYITGSAWKDYEQGKRTKSGIILPDGLRKNQKFETPIITNTTKATQGHDEDITREQILEQKLMTPEQLSEVERIMRALYDYGTTIAATRKLILVDTKYEIGTDPQGRIVLIDEIHTPDSSRYWELDSYQELFDQGEPQKELSKEFLRAWLTKQGFKGDEGQKTPTLPDDIIEETSKRYIALYERITGEQFVLHKSPRKRIIDNMLAQKLFVNGYVNIVAGSESDKEHYNAISKELEKRAVPHGVTILSAHKNTKELLAHLELMNTSAEPVVYIAVAGRSNALGGVLAATANNPRFPVINCPPFKDLASYQVDIHSSLRLPSGIPALTIIDPANAAQAATIILRLTGANI